MWQVLATKIRRRQLRGANSAATRSKLMPPDLERKLHLSRRDRRLHAAPIIEPHGSGGGVLRQQAADEAYGLEAIRAWFRRRSLPRSAGQSYQSCRRSAGRRRYRLRSAATPSSLRTARPRGLDSRPPGSRTGVASAPSQGTKPSSACACLASSRRIARAGNASRSAFSRANES